MPIFLYEALKPDGKKISGEIEADDRPKAIAKVRAAGLRPTKVAQKKEDPVRKAGVSARFQRKTETSDQPKATQRSAPGKNKKARGRVKGQELVDFATQFSVLQDAGLPIVRSLKVLTNQQKPKTSFRAVLEEVTDTVESGSTLSDAMASYPNAFDNLFCNMVRAGEAGGVLDVILNRLANFLEKAQRLRKKVIGASVYPIVVMSIAVLILTAIIIFVVPSFEEIFKAQKMDLPLPTEILLAISRGIVGIPGLIGVAAIFTFIMSFTLWGKTAAGRRKVDRWKLKLPLIGGIIRKSTTSRFCRMLGTLITSGVKILEALEMCQNAIRNKTLSEAVDAVRASIKEGESVAAPLAKTGMFDDLVVNMIDVGEETGELDKMLIKVADTYETEVDNAVESLTSVMEPILIVLMGGAIGFIVIALFLPLVSMMENIGK